MVASRIRQLLELYQLSPTQFADRIGVGRPVVSHILSGRNEPSLNVVQRVSEAFPELSLPWLLSGTGPMLARAAPGIIPAAAPDNTGTPPAATRRAAARPPMAAVNAADSLPANALIMNALEAVPVVIPPPVIPAAGAAGAVTDQPSEAVAGAPALPPLPAAPALDAPKTSSPLPLLPVPPTPTTLIADAAPFIALAEPGKAIRRIVIFYRDGSFADYLPEQ